MKNLMVFLPQVATYQLQDLGFIDSESSQMQISRLQSDWQSMFCQFVGVQDNDLPWTKLRMAQFHLDKTVKSACCCDPVLMQMTHRGAYMLGQANLELSQNDAIRIVAQINERIMRDGEHLFLVDKHAWLFTSKEPLTLSSSAFKDLIGKDIFNHPYTGEDAKYWQQRQTEIQMLIKEMIDYQGLTATTPETMIDVHFADLVRTDVQNEIPFIKNESISVLSDNELIKTFCMNSLLTNQPITATDSIEKNDVCLIAFDSERENYHSVVDFWKTHSTSKRLNTCQLICQDSCIEAKSSTGFFKRFFSKNAW